MWTFLASVSRVSTSKKILLLITARQQRSVDLAMLMFMRRGRGGGEVLMFSVELGDRASENLSGRV